MRSRLSRTIMHRRNSVNSEEKASLILSPVERKIILAEVVNLSPECEEIVRRTPIDTPITLTIDQWDDLGGCIAAEGNRTYDKKLQRKLDAIFCKIDDLVSSHKSRKPRIELRIFPPQEN
jgi:hypothetical protein